MKSTPSKHSTSQQTATREIKQLLDHEYRQNQRLPTLQQMADQFNVGMAAVRQAVSRLEAQGYLTTRRGSGIYVTGLSTKVIRVGIFGRLDGHLFEDISRALINMFGFNSQCATSMIPIQSDESFEVLNERLEQRIRIDQLDVLLAVGATQDSAAEALKKFQSQLPIIHVYDCGLSAELNQNGAVLSSAKVGRTLAIKHLKNVGCNELLVLSHQWATHHENYCIQAAGSTPVHVLRGTPNEDNYTRRVMAMFKKNPKIDGIFSFGDWRLASILPALRQTGRRVPQDVAVMGYGDTPWCNFFDVPLTSVNVQARELAKATYDMVQRGEFSQWHEIKPKLVVRASTDRNAADAS